MFDDRLYKWDRPRTARGLLLVLVPLAGLGAILALLGYFANDGGLMAGAVICLVGMLLYIGIHALDSNASEMVVLRVGGGAVIYSRIDSAMEMSVGSAGIRDEVERQMRKRFGGEYKKKQTFVLSKLQTAETWLFLGGDLRLQMVQGLGKVVLRVEWLTKDANLAAERLKKALGRIDYAKAAASKLALARCKRCGFVKPKKGSWACPECGLPLQGPDTTPGTKD